MSKTLDSIIRYENGELTGDEVVELFQDLLNTGLVFQLQGHYGRTAKALLDAGLIESPTVPESELYL